MKKYFKPRLNERFRSLASEEIANVFDISILDNFFSEEETGEDVW